MNNCITYNFLQHILFASSNTIQHQPGQNPVLPLEDHEQSALSWQIQLNALQPELRWKLRLLFISVSYLVVIFFRGHQDRPFREDLPSDHVPSDLCPFRPWGLPSEVVFPKSRQTGRTTSLGILQRSRRPRDGRTFSLRSKMPLTVK